MGNSVELFFKTPQGVCLIKKIVIGEVYTKGSGDSIDYSITIVSLFLNPLKIQFIYFNYNKFHARAPYYHSTGKRQTAVQHNAIHRMNHHSPISVVITYNTIHWIVIFPVDSIIHPLNQVQVIKRNFLHAQRHPIKGHNIHMHIKLSLPCEKCRAEHCRKSMSYT